MRLIACAVCRHAKTRGSLIEVGDQIKKLLRLGFFLPFLKDNFPLFLFSEHRSD